MTYDLQNLWNPKNSQLSVVLFGTEEECPGHYGIIDPSLDVQDIVDDAASSAKHLCNYHYGDSPAVKINTFRKYLPRD